jgi:hypothetical protein
MDIEEFTLERVQSRYENEVEINLTESGIHPFTLRELLTQDEIDSWQEAFSWNDLPKDVYLRRLYNSTTSYFDARTDVVTVTYQPDGSVQSYILWIQGAGSDDEEGRYFSISVNGLSGKSEVLDGQVPYPSAEEANFSAVMGPDAPGGAGAGLSGDKRK